MLHPVDILTTYLKLHDLLVDGVLHVVIQWLKLMIVPLEEVGSK